MKALPTTAQGWVDLAVQTGQHAFDETWKDGKLPPSERHMALVNVLVSSGIEAVLWEALRIANANAADRLAAEVAGMCEDGGVIPELLFEWRQRLDAGKPISGVNGVEGFGYRDLWARVGLTSEERADLDAADEDD